MTQLHKRFSDQQVAFLFHAYSYGLMKRDEVEESLRVGKTRFFRLWKRYQAAPESFSITYDRSAPKRISPGIEAAIETELLRERSLIEDPDIPISGYNYSALRDRLRKQGITISVNTIIDRAGKLGCHEPRQKKKTHDREVRTSSIGALIQHDGSTQRWSPFSEEKWPLITSIDDNGRMLLFADFFRAGSTWARIQTTQAVIEAFGLPLRYCVDSLRVFRFIQGRDSLWRNPVLQTDDVDTQWGKRMKALGVDVVYALSPQAKGKIERPYRWLQDRIIRTCGLEHIGELEEARTVLGEELDRYNHHQVHSTTKEIPGLRFTRAVASGNSLFRVFSLAEPYPSPKGIFCLREKRTTNPYGRISLFNHEIRVANVPLRQEVDVHLAPDMEKNSMQVRVWWQGPLAHSVDLPLDGFRVHF
jgi:hypothetical protein